MGETKYLRNSIYLLERNEDSVDKTENSTNSECIRKRKRNNFRFVV